MQDNDSKITVFLNFIVIYTIGIKKLNLLQIIPKCSFQIYFICFIMVHVCCSLDNDAAKAIKFGCFVCDNHVAHILDLKTVRRQVCE